MPTQQRQHTMAPATENPAWSGRALAVRRWAVIAACPLSVVLVVAGFLLDPYHGDGPEIFEAYAAAPGMQALHSSLLHYGYALWIVVALGLVWLVRCRGAWLANVAGVLAVLGLTTLPGLVIIDFHTVAVTTAHGVEATLEAERLLEQSAPFLALVIPAVLASLLAIPVATLAAWRAGLVRWWGAAATFAGFLSLQFASPPVGTAMFATGLLVLAWGLLRIPRARWFTEEQGSSH